MSKLTKYRTDGRCQPPPPVIDMEGELKYQVEKIVDKRTEKVARRSYIEYLVYWCSYDHAHVSWEPVCNLQHCQESI